MLYLKTNGKGFIYLYRLTNGRKSVVVCIPWWRQGIIFAVYDYVVPGDAFVLKCIAMLPGGSVS